VVVGPRPIVGVGVEAHHEQRSVGVNSDDEDAVGEHEDGDAVRRDLGLVVLVVLPAHVERLGSRAAAGRSAMTFALESKISATK
jgi:hypothetical protein